MSYFVENAQCVNMAPHMGSSRAVHKTQVFTEGELLQRWLNTEPVSVVGEGGGMFEGGNLS